MSVKCKRLKSNPSPFCSASTTECLLIGKCLPSFLVLLQLLDAGNGKNSLFWSMFYASIPSKTYLVWPYKFKIL